MAAKELDSAVDRPPSVQLPELPAKHDPKVGEPSSSFEVEKDRNQASVAVVVLVAAAAFAAVSAAAAVIVLAVAHIDAGPEPTKAVLRSCRRLLSLA